MEQHLYYCVIMFNSYWCFALLVVPILTVSVKVCRKAFANRGEQEMTIITTTAFASALTLCLLLP